MPKLTVMLEDELDDRFRRAVFESKGLRRGAITEAVEEAIEVWIEKQLEKDKGTK